MNKLSFGTDGIRGRASAFPLRNKDLEILADALYIWALRKNYAFQDTKKIILGYDTRTSCERIKKCLLRSLCRRGLLLVDVGVLPTPALLALLSATDAFTFGIMISASHNSFLDNGIKIFTKEGGKISAPDEDYISNVFNDLYAKKSSCTYPHNAENSPSIIKENMSNIYHTLITQHFPPSFLKGIKIVLDCAHGATHRIAPLVFSHFGASVHTLHDQPNGRNINEKSGVLHPQQLQKTVREKRADIGFAFDGDGDRVLAVTSQGTIKNGDDILALLTMHPAYKNQKIIIGTIMTNKGLEEFLKDQKKRLIRTPVGDKHIVKTLQAAGLLLGGETSGHIIMRDYLATGDGIFTALRLLEAIISTSNWKLESFDHYPQIEVNIAIEHKKNLHKKPFSDIITTHKDLLDKGRVIVRYSGTENLLRVMAEDDEYQRAYDVAQALAKKLETAHQ